LCALGVFDRDGHVQNYPIGSKDLQA
jgi:hypothetical protein